MLAKTPSTEELKTLVGEDLFNTWLQLQALISSLYDMPLSGTVEAGLPSPWEPWLATMRPGLIMMASGSCSFLWTCHWRMIFSSR